MFGYALIGLGGALGSMARAAVAEAVARLTGPAFPWGTILINITGSFLIGLVAGLTVAHGRAPGLAAARTFLMVGFCGGYTTFSSFSLQTLDLLRDGRGAQAAGNVVVSVLLCLGAVAVGHRAGTALRAAPRHAAATAGPVLAVIDRPDRAAAVLAAAGWLRAGIGAPALRALLVTPASAPFLPEGEVLTAERAAEADAEAGRARLRAAVAGWSGGDLTETEEHPAAEIAAAGARAVVLARPGPHDPPWVAEALHAALFAARAPVLALPPSGPDGAIGAVVAIGWRSEDPSAAAALDAAAPLLARARRILLLHVGEALPLPAALLGRPAQSLGVPRNGAAAGAALLAAAAAEGADLLVMGAYSHGPWREAVLGGMTRHVLTHASIPLLLRH